MSHTSCPLVVPIAAALLVGATPALAVSPDVEEAIQLMKQMHQDQCQQRKLRGQLLVAHQAHDEGRLSDLGPQLEALNKRLKPAEDRLSILKVNIRKNPQDQSAFETAQLAGGDCD